MNPWPPPRRPKGFTLIEVIGALLIFSVGVLMVIQVSGALGTQMSFAAASSEIVVFANERLDSLEATPFDSVSTGITTDTLTVGSFTYERVTTISEITPVLYQIDITLTPQAGTAPTYTATSYTSAIW